MRNVLRRDAVGLYVLLDRGFGRFKRTFCLQHGIVSLFYIGNHGLTLASKLLARQIGRQLFLLDRKMDFVQLADRLRHLRIRESGYALRQVYSRILGRVR